VEGERTFWRGHRLGYVASEPLLVSLLRYRASRDRELSDPGRANLVSSRDMDGRQWPVLDLDVPHRYVPSSTSGHAHLYIDVPTSTWRWALLMLALRLAGVHELGYTAWSLRRGASFVRPPGVRKEPVQPPSVLYGWLRPVRRR
jgi:hypothetical protein